MQSTPIKMIFSFAKIILKWNSIYFLYEHVEWRQYYSAAFENLVINLLRPASSLYITIK
jgi:hypothetical protein